jgi:hypothetical protein
VPARKPPHRRLWGRPLQPQKHGRSCRTSSTLQHHSPGGGPGDFDLQLHCGWHRWILGWGNTTRRRRSDPPWGTHGPGGVRFPYFFSLDGRSPVSHPTCEAPFPRRRSGLVSSRPARCTRGAVDRFGIPNPRKSGSVIGADLQRFGPSVCC